MNIYQQFYEKPPYIKATISDLAQLSREESKFIILKNSSPTKREIEEKISILYEISGFKRPLFVWALSPLEFFFHVIYFADKQEKLSYDSDSLLYNFAEKKELFLMRAKESFKDIKSFEKFLKRVNKNINRLSNIDKGSSIKCKIFPEPHCDMYFERMMGEKKINIDKIDKEFGRYHIDMVLTWLWIETVFSEVDRIFHIEYAFPLDLWEPEYIKSYEFLTRIWYIGAPITPSEIFTFGYLPNLTPFLEIVHIHHKFNEQEKKRAKILLDIFKHGVMFFPYENICWIIEAPSKIKLLREIYNSGYEPYPNSFSVPWLISFDDKFIYLPHSTRGPAITFRDGFCVWAFTGILMPPKYFKAYFKKDTVYTSEMVLKLWEYGKHTYFRSFWERFIINYIDEIPSYAIPVDLIFKEENAQIRAKLISKVGVQRIVEEKNPKIIDKWQDYELIEIDLPVRTDFIKARFLKMKNPSTDGYHIEGVPPEVNSCKQALSWRIGGIEWEPLEIT